MCIRDRGIGAGEVNLNSVIIHLRTVCHIYHAGAECCGVDEVIDGVDHIVRVKGCSVVADHVLAKLKGVGAFILGNLPGFSQLAYPVSVFILIHQCVIELAVNNGCDLVCGIAGVKGCNVA